jgi:DNA-binding transcriptional MerR regulator
MHIGELSRTARVSIQTLRFYEREKLLREPPRTRIRRRIGSFVNFDQLANLIVGPAARGISLKSLR